MLFDTERRLPDVDMGSLSRLRTYNAMRKLKGCTNMVQVLHRNVQRFRDGLAFKAHRLSYPPPQDEFDLVDQQEVVKKKEEEEEAVEVPKHYTLQLCSLNPKP